VKRGKNRERFRHSSAITVAGLIAAIAGISVATWQPYLLVVLVIPLGVSLWSWRAGTDVDPDGLTVRAAIGQRRVPWSTVAGIQADRKRVVVILTSGGRVVLTAVTPADLPRVVTAAGGDPIDRAPAAETSI
jgi:hypothetical protein